MLLLKRSLFFSLIVFLFTYTPATSAELKLTASDGEAYDWFGGSVSISGDYAIVGVPGDDDNGDDSGSAYISSSAAAIHSHCGLWLANAALCCDIA